MKNRVIIIIVLVFLILATLGPAVLSMFAGGSPQ